MATPPEIRTLTGRDPDLRGYIPDLARLRIEVFKAFPYLYDGSAAYEEAYLETYLRCEESVVILAIDRERVIGASTGLPLEAETLEFQKPFLENGYDPRRIFYCAESVLLPEYRGQGIYGHFFKGREGHARRLARFDLSAFCCVSRQDNHPLKPESYAPLDPIWNRFGYVRHQELETGYHWKDVDQAVETEKRMVFWLKNIGASPA